MHQACQLPQIASGPMDGQRTRTTPRANAKRPGHRGGGPAVAWAPASPEPGMGVPAYCALAGVPARVLEGTPAPRPCAR
jgi:hypothetical protein